MKSTKKRDLGIADTSYESIIQWQRPGKIIGRVAAAGFGDVVHAECNVAALHVILRFTSGLEIILRPRFLLIGGEEVRDDDLPEWLSERRSQNHGESKEG